MGAVYKDACFDSALDASASMCSSEYPRSDNDQAGNLRSFTCSVGDGTYVTIASSTPALAASASTVVPVAFTGCDPGARAQQITDIWIDGMVALGTVVAWKLAFSFLFKDQ